VAVNGLTGENVEIVRRGFEAFEQDGVDGLLTLAHEDFEATTPPGLASEPDTYVGHDGVRRYFASFYEVMDDIRWEAHAFHGVGEKVVVECTVYARGKSTGLEFGQFSVQVWTLRDGKATRLELYATLDEALQAAGDDQA
jgi:ketosteroid isomerase-like protein